MNPLVIFSDLDGTLLNHHDYRFDDAEYTLDRLKQYNIPCVLNTSKTYAELDALNKSLALNAPFIIENGAAVYIPKSSDFETNQLTHELNIEQSSHYIKKAFGPSRNDILSILSSLKSAFAFTGFADMTVQDLIQETQLSKQEAKLALQREYTEPLIWQDSEEAFARFQSILHQHGLQTQKGGRFIHVMGKQCDKAYAMNWLAEYFQHYYRGPITTMALGDGGNDVAMIAQADIGIVIRSPVHQPPTIPNKSDIYITQAHGPKGWSEAINKELHIRELI